MSNKEDEGQEAVLRSKKSWNETRLAIVREEMGRWLLVNSVVPQEEFEAETMKLAGAQ